MSLDAADTSVRATSAGMPGFTFGEMWFYFGTGPRKTTGTCCVHVFPFASIPLNPKVWVAGTVRVLYPNPPLTVPFAGMLVPPGKKVEICSVAPSIVKPLSVAAMPATSCSTMSTDQLIPLASGGC